MRDEPPWEWVEGDQSTASLFGVVTGVLLGVASVGFVATTISLLNLSGIWSGLVIPSWVTPACLLPMVGGVFFLILFPTRYPIVRRLGISPIGIRLEFPLRSSTVKWPAVRWIGPNYVDVKTGLGSGHIRLTANQVQRISHFVQPYWTAREKL